MLQAMPSQSTKGLSLFEFLQSLEAEKRTCLIQVSSKNKQGFLYFVSGKLADALCDEYEGEAAAYHILCWENVEIELREMVRKQQSRADSINKPLSILLKEAVWLKNENNRANQATRQTTVAPLAEASSTENKFSSKVINFEKPHRIPEETKMGNINECLTELMKVDGAMAASVVDAKSGMALGMIGGGINLEIAAAGNSEVIRAKLKTMQSLNLKDKIEDILITLGQQYHLIRPLTIAPNLFIYFVLNKAQANLAMARFKLSDMESKVEI